MTDDFDSDDIGQMRQQGDLRAFLRGLSGRPVVSPNPDVVPPAARADGRPVGAWPAGAHQPGCPVFGFTTDACPCSP